MKWKKISPSYDDKEYELWLDYLKYLLIHHYGNIVISFDRFKELIKKKKGCCK